MKLIFQKNSLQTKYLKNQAKLLGFLNILIKTSWKIISSQHLHQRQQEFLSFFLLLLV